MIKKIIKSSFINQKKAIALMVASIAVGTALVSSLLTISIEIVGKVSKELRSFGANIILEPKIEGIADISGQARYLRYDDIIKAKTIFWRHNIIGIAPFLELEKTVTLKNNNPNVRVSGTWIEKKLSLPGESGHFLAGTKTVFPWWGIDGRWPDSDEDIIIGSSLSSRFNIKIGDNILIENKSFTVSGILHTGGKEEESIFLNLETLQELSHMKGKISRVYVSALTTPMDEFAYRDPDTMTKTEYEKWYCTGYVTSIAKQLEEVFSGSKAKPIWNIAETEGRVLERLKILIYLLSIIAIIASALGVSTTMIMSILRRIEEIGLMKAIGADKIKIIVIFLTEGLLIGILGGLLGYLISLYLSQYIGIQVFNTGLEQKGILLPVSIIIAISITIIGTILPIKRALKIKPSIVLKGIR